MMMHLTWTVCQTKILTRRELAAVFRHLRRRGRNSLNARLSLVVMRLACCCGLRAGEISELRLDDVRLQGDRPHLRIRNGKRGKSRIVPLWWDVGTLNDIREWKDERQRQGAKDGDLLICSMLANRRGHQLDRHALRLRFQRACGVLGDERRSHVTIHHGRHTFVSHALAGGRTLAEVRDAAGHCNVAITSVYLHLAVDDDGQPGDLFAFEQSR